MEGKITKRNKISQKDIVIQIRLNNATENLLSNIDIALKQLQPNKKVVK
jgi:hypothetical protein